jgi:hypothetical protein
MYSVLDVQRVRCTACQMHRMPGVLSHAAASLRPVPRVCRPLEAGLQGADVVLQSEDPQLVNNAQMASAAGHPLWRDVMAAITARAGQGMRDPLHATGPHMLTQVLRVRAAGPQVVSKSCSVRCPVAGWLKDS